jgi:hypothetical protein
VNICNRALQYEKFHGKGVKFHGKVHMATSVGGNEIFMKNKISSRCYFDVKNL